MGNRAYQGLIVGAGSIASEVVNNCDISGKNIFLIAIKGISDQELVTRADLVIGIGEIGKAIKGALAAGVRELAIIGYVKRPDFSQIKFDATGLSLLPKMIAAGKDGDDALMRIIINEFEKNEINIVGPEKISGAILAKSGAIGALVPNGNDIIDIKKARKLIDSMSAFDIGQAVIICDGLVLAVEAQEGTDAMIKRINTLPKHLIGTPENRRGILFKGAKKSQDRRIDLPTIGLDTLQNAISANLRGIAIEADGAFIANLNELKELANRNGLFIFGLENE